MLFRDYFECILKIKPQLESLTGKLWDIPDTPELWDSLDQYDLFSLGLTFGNLPAYAYMVYMRHHGFPSPLLDWTRSSRVAAYFAFSKAFHADSTHVSIYVFSEAQFRVRGNKIPMIFRLGPYVRTHPRHFLQQCDYTMCVSYDSEWRFEPYSTVFEEIDVEEGQASFWKFNVPTGERPKVLRILDESNVNAFSLFGSEEGLMQTMAMRELELNT